MELRTAGRAIEGCHLGAERAACLADLRRAVRNIVGELRVVVGNLVEVERRWIFVDGLSLRTSRDYIILHFEVVDICSKRKR